MSAPIFRPLTYAKYAASPADPVRADAEFLGWYTTPEGDGELFDDSARFWKDAVYYARWNVLFDVTSDGVLLGVADGAVLPSDLVIPDGITGIGAYAFFGETSFTSVTIPDSVTWIESSAFSGCTGLTSVTIPDSVTSIGERAFWDCTGLMSVAIGNGVTSIGRCAFEDCTGLTSVTFENTAGWYRTSSSTATSGYTLSSSGLADPSTAAEWLGFYYDRYYWKRNA